MRVDQLNIVVEDVAAAVAFYERLGIVVDPIDEEWAAWLPHHRTVRSPGSVDVDIDSVAFAKVWGGIDEPTVVVGLRVDTREAVDAAHADATANGATTRKEPYDAFWGARYAVVEDPSGTVVGIMSPADPARRTDGPPPPPPPPT